MTQTNMFSRILNKKKVVNIGDLLWMENKFWEKKKQLHQTEK